MSRSKIVLGGPGCGKTTYLLKQIDEYLAGGGSPTRIAYLSFTRRAIHEARERALNQLDIADANGDDPLPYFRTIHSIATRLRQNKTKKFLTRQQFLEWCEHVDLEKGSRKLAGWRLLGPPDVAKPTSDDVAMFAVNYARMMERDLEEVCEWLGSSYDLARLRNDEYRSLLDEGFVDYTGVLEDYVQSGEEPPLDLLIVDEAQDLSAIQWHVVDKLAANAKAIIYAGDDDQAIYEWSGADVNHFLSLRDTCEKIVLPKSHRLPKDIWQECVAFSKRGISDRIEKEFDPHHFGGIVEKANTLELNLLAQDAHPVWPGFSSGETWFLLGRTGYHLSRYRAILRTHGVPYMENNVSSIDNKFTSLIKSYIRAQEGGTVTVEEYREIMSMIDPAIEVDKSVMPQSLDNIRAEHMMTRTDVPWFDALDFTGYERTYFKQILDTYGSFDFEPKITIGTIHSVKGGEADNVVLDRRITTKIRRGIILKPDSEPRVFYVGMSRAKKRLFYLINDKPGEEFRV